VRQRFPVAVVTTVGAGVALVWCGTAFGVRSATFGVLVVWLVMCWWGVVGRLYPVSLPDAWFRLRPWEREGRVYAWVGATVLKALLRRGPLSWFNPSLHLPRERTRESLLALDRGMRHAETAHAVLFVIVLPVIVHALARGWWRAAVATLLADVVVNAWPVALQRYNRGRLARLLPRT
jgi:hypothetical protein